MGCGVCVFSKVWCFNLEFSSPLDAVIYRWTFSATTMLFLDMSKLSIFEFWLMY